jgi:tight adherence protein B
VEEAVIFPLLTFAAVFAVIYGAYWGFVLRPEDAALGKVRRRLTSAQAVKASIKSGLLKEQQALSALGPIDALLRRSRTGMVGLQRLIEQAGVKVTVGAVVAASGLLALVCGYFTWRATGWPVLAAPAAVAVSTIPVSILKRLRTLRLRKFEEQFPEALDLMSRALRAGHAFTTGLEMVASEMPAPVAQEFRLLFDQQNYGMPLPQAFKTFAERIPVLDARFFATAVLIQRESGGNLSEVLDNLSGVIRERFRVKRQMRVISAHGRITGWVLVGLPPVLGAALMTVNQEHRQLMFGDTLGLQMIVGAAILQVIGTLIIRKIINIEY